MIDLQHLSDITARALADIKYPGECGGLYTPVDYTLSSGGKRLRPALCLAACQAVCGDPLKALDQAIAIEMFHNFTLIHDDVMDRSDTRRGRPTVYAKWGDVQAILSGDALLTMATARVMMCDDDKLRPVLDCFNDTAQEVYIGQQLDMEFESDDNVTVDEYLRMIFLKTSALLCGSISLGAIVAGADRETVNALYRYAKALGLAFQLRDDWLDTFGDAATFGKPIGGDIVNEKKTWMLITARRESHGELDAILDEDLEPAEKIRQVTRLYERLRVGDRCDAAAAEHHALAIAALDKAQLAEPQLREFFIETVDRMASRKL